MNDCSPELKAQFHTSIAGIDAALWDGLTRNSGPLLSHRFLSILEQTGAVGGDSGWEPNHLVLKQGERILAVMPLYIKTHSWGEYVFDWSWAEAWNQLGIPYYPKLVTAIPLTPVAGPRLCMAADADRRQLTLKTAEAIFRFALEQGISGWHLLYPSDAEVDDWQQLGLAQRLSCNFHWFNREYEDYEAFLADMTSRSRKSMRRERQKIHQQGLKIRQFTGEQAEDIDWHRMYLFYRNTCMQRGHPGYLDEDFFMAAGELMAKETLLTMAFDGTRPVAGAFCFYDSNTLYGRYWGAAQHYDSLHFELCYHRGIEFCIANGLQRYDPGAQGEHKIRRGFIPVFGHSMHWLAEERLRPAVQQFCQQEQRGLLRYRDLCRSILPFRADKSALMEPPEGL